MCGVDGPPPAWRHVAPNALASEVAATVGEVRHRHKLTGVVAPIELHPSLTEALAAAGWRAVDHLHELARDEIPLFGPEQVKGLEFDGVVVVEPDDILGDTTRGARLLYVAMTRAVQELTFLTTRPTPTPPSTPESDNHAIAGMDRAREGGRAAAAVGQPRSRPE